MKKCMIYVLLSLIGVPTIQAQMLTYEEMVKKITVYMPEMNIKDFRVALAWTTKVPMYLMLNRKSKTMEAIISYSRYPPLQKPGMERDISNTTISFLCGMVIFLPIYMNERGKKEDSHINNMSQL